MAAAAWSCSAPQSGPTAAAHVRLAIGGQNQMVYLPTTLAQDLGYSTRPRGSTWSCRTSRAAPKALQALVGGSADVVSGLLRPHHSDGGRGPPARRLRHHAAVSGAGAGDIAASGRDRDRHPGSQGAASSASRRRAPPRRCSSRSCCRETTCPLTRSASRPSAAPRPPSRRSRHGKVDAGWMADPSFTLIKRRNPNVRVLADLRDEAGVKAAFGTGSYPAAVLYSSGEWVRGHPDVARVDSRAPSSRLCNGCTAIRPRRFRQDPQGAARRRRCAVRRGVEETRCRCSRPTG